MEIVMFILATLPVLAVLAELPVVQRVASWIASHN